MVEKGFLFRIYTRTGLVIIYPWRLDGERVKADAMAMAKKCSRLLGVHCKLAFELRYSASVNSQVLSSPPKPVFP